MFGQVMWTCFLLEHDLSKFAGRVTFCHCCIKRFVIALVCHLVRVGRSFCRGAMVALISIFVLRKELLVVLSIYFLL